MNKTFCIACILIAAASLWMRCSKSPVAAGTSEQGNALTVSGFVVDSLGEGTADVQVRLLPPSFNPVTDSADLDKNSARTNKKGLFVIEQVPQGVYSMNAVDSRNSRRFLRPKIAVTQSNVSTDTATLRNTGTITIQAAPSAASESSYVYIPGTDVYAPISNPGPVTLASPHATVNVNVLYRSSPATAVTNTIIENVSVTEGKDTAFAEKEISFANESNQWRTLHPDWLWCDDFEVSQDLKANYQDISGKGMVIDSIDSFSGRYALCQHYTAGQTEAGWIIRVDTAGYPDHLFVRFYQKFEEGFSRSSMTMAGISSRERFGSWTKHFSYGLTLDSGEIVTVQNCPQSSQANSSGYLADNHTGFVFTDAQNDGRWILIEMELQLNTPGSSNGAFRLWIDDSLKVEKTGVDIRGDNSFKINEVILSGTFNGSGSPKIQRRFFDNLVISTQRIGPARMIKYE